MVEKSARQLAAVMFTDVVGYTAMMQRNEEEALFARARQRDATAAAAGEHGGKVVQHYGDGSLTVFPSAVAAVSAAIDIQRALARDRPVPIRIGVHQGEVSFDDQGAYGDAVNVAARIQGLAVPGSVLVSEKVFDELKNGPSIPTVTLGHFRLKNVELPMVIHAVAADGLEVPTRDDVEQKDPSAAKEFVAELKRPRDTNELLSRRVPQLLALYVGMGWGILEFMTFVEDRYLISPAWVDICFISLFLMLPSVLLLTWNHGRPGKDEVTRMERVFVPTNLILALTVITMLFRGQDLGAVTTTVTLEDEDGTQIQRVIPKSTFRKRVGLFLFEPAGTTEAWALRSFRAALYMDLSQDLFVDFGTRNSAERLERAGFRGGSGVPFSLMREIAQEQNREFFVTGQLDRSGGTWTVTYQLYDTRRGRSLADRAFAGEDLMVLVDKVSLALRDDLEIPSRHIEESTDLPAGEIFTRIGGAVEAYGRALEAVLVESDYARADSLMAIAVEEDPGFALAHWDRYTLAVFNGQPDRGMPALEAAVHNSYRLPERDRFQVNAELHILRQQHERALASFQMKVELFPDDIQGHAGLAQMRLLRGEPVEAIASYERILEIDPGQTDFLATIGELYQAQGQFDRARDYYERFAEAFPGDARPLGALAGLFILTGEHDAAIDQLNRAMALEPNDVGNVLSLAQVAASTGDFETAEKHLGEASAIASTPVDRATVLGGLRTYAEFRGRYAEALERAQAALQVSSTFRSAAETALQRLSMLELFVRAGDTVGAFAALEQAEAGLEGPLVGLANIGRTRLFRELEQPDRIDEAVRGLEQTIDAYGFEVWRPRALGAKAEAHALRGEYPEALTLLEQAIELEPTNMVLRAEAMRVLRSMGELEKARTALEEAVRVRPYSPRVNLELGLVYKAQGRREDAREQFRRARLIWAEADPGHRWAADLEEALRDLDR